MDAIRKQASKLREQVAKQQQAVFKQFGSGYLGTDNMMAHDAELQQHQKLERLYISTRCGKVQSYRKTVANMVPKTLVPVAIHSKDALCFSTARAQMEKEHGILLKSLGTQVAEPLRAMVVGAPLEDARHLAQKYDRLRQEAEAQAIEVSRRQAKVRESTATADNYSKLEAAEVKLHELKGNVAILGKEAAAAMAAVEAQQQRLTLQRLISMVESERNYHHRVLQILDQLEGEMTFECQHINGSSPTSAADNYMPPPPPYDEVNDVFASPAANGPTDSMGYFLGEVIHRFQPVSDVELSLSVGDYIVVRKVSNNGWAEGECKGKAGWFPFGYIERRDRVLASKVTEIF